MNKEENQLILKALEQEIKPQTFFSVKQKDENIHGFIFDIYGAKVHITGNGEDTIFKFIHLGKEFLTYSMPFEETKEFLHKIHKRFINQDGFNYKESEDKDLVIKEIEVIKKFLREYQGDAPYSNNSSMEIVSEINGEELKHLISPGSVLCRVENNNEKYEHLNCTIIGELKLRIEIRKPLGDWDQFALYIPCWEMEKYPLIMKYITKIPKDEKIIKECVNDVNTIISNLNIFCPNLASNLMYGTLENKIKNKNDNVIKKKKV